MLLLLYYRRLCNTVSVMQVKALLRWQRFLPRCAWDELFPALPFQTALRLPVALGGTNAKLDALQHLLV